MRRIILLCGDHMKFRNPFLELTAFEIALWAISATAVTASFLLSSPPDYLTLTASLIGVSALIFVAKGMVFGQILTIAFSLFYGIVSYYFGYYGEMITYLCMSTPAACAAVVSWIKNPYGDTASVKVAEMTPRKFGAVGALSLVVTVIFYFLLGALNTENLAVSTLSVTTSVFAASLVFLRSPYYALAYALNDIVLIVLWILATVESLSYLPMVICFVMFLFNDLYAYFNWKRMQRNQAK